MILGKVMEIREKGIGGKEIGRWNRELGKWGDGWEEEMMVKKE